MNIRNILICVLIVKVASCTLTRNITEVKLAVLVPITEKDSRYFSLRHVRPAIEIAIENIQNGTEFYNDFKFTVTYADSKCDISQGINAAIQMYMKDKVHVFLGPTCDYSVAPVARQVRYWNIPIMTCGGMSRDFREYRSRDYTNLIRAGPVFYGLSNCLSELSSRNNWKKLKLLYYRKGQSHIFEDFCYLMSRALLYDLKDDNPHIKQDYFKLDPNVNMETIFKQEIASSYSSCLQKLKGGGLEAVQCAI